MPESSRVCEPGETCDALPGWEVPEDGLLLLDAPRLEASDASPGDQLGAGNPSTAVDSDELDVGFDIGTVELDDLLFAACGKIKVIARDPPDNMRELVERAAQMLFDAAGEADRRDGT